MAISLNSDTAYFTLQVGIYDTVSTAFEPTSKTQTADYYQKCNQNEVYLTWLNSLACWEYWLFTAAESKGFQINTSGQASKNTFENWDTQFVNQETEQFYNFVEAVEQRIIRSQRVKPELALAISRIKYAIQVQEILVDNTKLTVRVDKGGLLPFKSNDKLTELNFTILGTQNLPIQEQ